MIEIPGRKIGPGEPCFIVAEAGVNHNGDLDRAFELVDIAVSAGVDAVKFQTFSTGALVSRHAPQYAMLKRLELPPAAFQELAAYCVRKQVLFLSTPFDEGSAEQLNELGVPLFKLPSGELTNLPFIRKLSSYRKPLIVSTGMATMAEIREAVAQIGVPFALLQCVSAYPAPASAVNLRAMSTLASEFGVPVGYSDHTLGAAVALAAVALGASVLEKHFTSNRALPGPDHHASLEPLELRTLVEGVRTVEAALGDGLKRPALVERATAETARKSVVAARNIAAGTAISADVLAVRRPGTGLSPALRESIIGRVARVEISEGTPIDWEFLV